MDIGVLGKYFNSIMQVDAAGRVPALSTGKGFVTTKWKAGRDGRKRNRDTMQASLLKKIT